MMPDPLTTVRYGRTPYRATQQWAIPVLVGRLIPGLDEPAIFRFTGEHLLGQMARKAMAASPAVMDLGVTPQLLESGLELGDAKKLSAIADPVNNVNRLRQLSVAVRHAPEEAVQRLGNLVREAGELLDAGAADGKVDEQTLTDFRASAAHSFAGPLSAFGDLFDASADVKVLLRDVRRARLLFDLPVDQPFTREAVLALVPAARNQLVAGIEKLAAAIRETFAPVLPTYAAAAVYFQNLAGVNEVLFMHTPADLPPAEVADAAIGEIAHRKLPCADVVLLQRVRSPAELTTHWAGSFQNEPEVQAIVFAGLQYTNADHLREISESTELVGGTGAGHLMLFAGRGVFRGHEVPVHPALAARRRAIDAQLNPADAHYGLLESSFGAQEDKAIFGFEDLDSLEWRDGWKADLAEHGINTLTRTDGQIHAFRLRSLSKDLAHCQADAVRGRQWFIGTTRAYLRKVAPGRCNDSALKREVADRLTKILSGPFVGKSDFKIRVTPGSSSDPREFILELGLPQLAYVEKVTIHAKLLGDE
jgi:hypothetical protein